MLMDSIGRSASQFTIQWHLTHACELHCKHCYDRTKLAAMKLSQAIDVLDQLVPFCREREVRGAVCLTGGNPFLYRHFFEVYQAAFERGLRVAIYGNPVSAEELDRLVAIGKPGYFQVSLEGLEEHNDAIRGEGYFRRVLSFLPMLSERGIPPVVMATLTEANVDELIPLARVLRGKVNRFAFNRLSAVGEGAGLRGVEDKERYGRFMIDWMVEAQRDPALYCKDNLFNVFRHELGQPLYGGCTGVGCGAAFNFVALLPNLEVHACRKFPSRIGSLTEASLAEVYDSELAMRYRRGCSACDGCAIRHRCGGCLAVSHGSGLDPFTERDPQCFMHD